MLSAIDNRLSILCTTPAYVMVLGIASYCQEIASLPPSLKFSFLSNCYISLICNSIFAVAFLFCIRQLLLLFLQQFYNALLLATPVRCCCPVCALVVYNFISGSWKLKWIVIFIVVCSLTYFSIFVFLFSSAFSAFFPTTAAMFAIFKHNSSLQKRTRENKNFLF